MAFDNPFPDLNNVINGLTSSLLGTPPPPSINTFPLSSMPWNANAPVKSPFFHFVTPNPNLWDKLVPYRLLVWDSVKNKVVGGGAPDEVIIEPLGNGTLSFTPMSNAWSFDFPITPQSLSITDAYSINTSATLRGILEEHSGVRFKNINIQGTFGVWPGRFSIVEPPSTPNLLQSVFGGVIAAAENVVSQFTSIVDNITSGSNSAKPKNIRPDNTNQSELITSSTNPEYGGFGTGYYQTMMLTQFLEQYAEAKRNPDNASWRLVFDIPKQNQSFVVTPVGFTWSENVNRPMEINYNIQLKAWRRINLGNKITLAASDVTPLTPGILQRVLNTISAAQNTAAAAVNLIGAVRSDVGNILNIIRQTGLFVKGLAGVAIAASDLPALLVGDAKSTISDFIATINPNNLFGSAATDNTTLNALAQIKALNSTTEGVSRSAVSNNQLGSTVAAAATLNPSNVVFSNPLEFPLLLGQVPVSGLTLNITQEIALQKELDTVNAFTVSDLKNMRNTILTLTTQLASSFGAGSAGYSALFDQPPPSNRTQPMTPDEFAILSPFYELLQTYDVLTATNQIDNDQVLNTLEYVSALAQNSGIDFPVANSKIQAPVPFGLNIEQIAMRYLGDAQRWIEIATINELREPYIDENGFVLPLLSNADGRSIVVGSDFDLRIGQKIFLYSNTQTPTARTILNITGLSQTSFLLTLDGLANLDVFKTVDQAYIQAYLPGTVNSQNVIFIPSDIQTPAFDDISIPSSVANVDLVGLSKVDWLLDQYGDLAITNTGDFRLAAGITNIIQCLQIKFGTQLGSSLLDPDFGLGLKSGIANADLNAKDVYNQIVGLITADPRFSGVSGLQINVSGPSVGISLAVQLAGIKGVFPIGFELPTTQ